MRGVQLAVRSIALVVLALGFIATAAAAQPRMVDYDEFARALDHGAVTSVQFDGSRSNERTIQLATWSAGPFDWRRGPIVDRPSTLSEVSTRLDDRGVRIDDDSGDSPLSWAFRIPTWFGTLVATTWLLTFIVMLGSRPRWGNRWAWFWMFVIGQIGVLLYLLIEPSMLGRREVAAPPPEASDGSTTTARDPRVSGERGCWYSILAAVGTAFLAAGIGWAVNRVIG